MRLIPMGLGIAGAILLAPRVMPLIPVNQDPNSFGLDDAFFIAWLTFGAWAGQRFLPSMGA